MENCYFVGIDVSKETLDFTVLQGSNKVHYFRSVNSEGGLKEFFKSCPQEIDLKNAVFCMEHTGIYNFYAIEYLVRKKYALWVESANRIKKSQGFQRGKSDKIDSERIALYAFKNRDEIKLWQPPRREITTLKRLLSMRSRLQQVKKIILVPLKENAAFSRIADTQKEKKFSAKTVASIKQDLKNIDAAIIELIRSDEHLKQLFTLVSSVEGIGTIVAANMLVTTNEFKAFPNAKKFACYAGVAPFDHSSGKSIRGRTRVSALANQNMKTLFHLAALGTIRFKGNLRDFYTRKVAEGKNKMLVLNAIRNKLIHRIFAVVRDGNLYQKNYVHPLQLS